MDNRVKPNFSSDIYVHDVSLTFRERPSGKVVLHTDGRLKNGMFYLISGVISLEGNDAALLANSGDIVLMPKHSKYILKHEADSSYVLINFDLSEACGNDLPLWKIPILVPSSFVSREVIDLFFDAKNAALDDGATTVFKKNAILFGLLSALNSNEDIGLTPSDPLSKKIEPGVKILRKHYLENIPVTELAAACYISASMFRRLFGLCYGMSPIKYRNLLRIKKADELIDSGDYTVSEIALLAGFASESYFCRYYKKMTGKTPTDIRRRKNGGQN